MSGGKQLPFLAVFVLLVRCQQKPTVTMTPELKTIFSGDLFYLGCNSKTSGSSVKWYFNDSEQHQTKEIFEIAVASPKHSGSYQCETNGQKSDTFSISVIEHGPSASLTIKTGHPVMPKGGAVILQLYHEDGLDGWLCWVYRREKKQRKSIRFKSLDTPTDFTFQTLLTDPMSIFWCTNKTQQEKRSNQVTVRISDQDIFLEMYPLPAVVGEPLTLRCLVWGTDRISKAVFYKGDTVIADGKAFTHKIKDVTESTEGKYKCDATYTHVARTAGPDYHKFSDVQDVFVQVAPIKAVLDTDNGLRCSCSRCGSDVTYHWYKKTDDRWERMDVTSNPMTPEVGGNYACKAKWKTSQSVMSNVHTYHTSSNLVMVLVILLVVAGSVTVLIGFIFYRRRNVTGPVYEDVPRRLQEGDENYEMLQKAGSSQRETPYDTLQPEASGRAKKEGEYEAAERKRE
ncbi:uncharacterized protein LOC108875553 [Lates calcarifer]|uniref:Uncharacterized protein LOC108875553 n=1 Tax=Lates calcarifer TaxID=8187 RepID=A0AAJ7LCR6_LATCA|nr:uncharacterized protein LOC108875553 [Lates calcarifer]